MNRRLFFCRMRIAFLPSTVVAAAFLWLWALEVPASAAPRKPMRKASDMIRRQEGPRINKDLEAVINPGNSRVYISLSKQRAYLMVGEQVYIDTPISSGKRAGITPTGNFSITQKDPNHRSSLYGDFVDRNG